MAGVHVKSCLLQQSHHRRRLFGKIFCLRTSSLSTVLLPKSCTFRSLSYLAKCCSGEGHKDCMLHAITFNTNPNPCLRTFSCSTLISSSTIKDASSSTMSQGQPSVLHDEISNCIDTSHIKYDDNCFTLPFPLHANCNSFDTSTSMRAASNATCGSCQTVASHSSIHATDSVSYSFLSLLENNQALSSLVTHKHSSFIDYFIPNVSAASEVVVTTDAYGWLSTYIHLFASLASSAPVLKIMSWLQDIHALLGMPWWLSIILTTVALRTAITIPLAIYQQRVLAKVELLRAEMIPLMPRLADETRAAKLQFGWDDRSAQLYFRKLCKKTWDELIVRDNCHPGKGVVLLLGQLPLWIMFSVAFRNLALCYPVANDAALATHQELSTQGLPWCQDLTLPDASLALPLSMALVNIVITEISVLQRPQVVTTAGVRRLTWVLRGAALIVVPIAIHMPAGVVLYWVTSSGCALAQTLLLMHPRVRVRAGIPLTPSTQLHPYSRIASIIAMKIRGQQVPLESTEMPFELQPQLKKKKEL